MISIYNIFRQNSNLQSNWSIFVTGPSYLPQNRKKLKMRRIYSIFASRITKMLLINDLLTNCSLPLLKRNYCFFFAFKLCKLSYPQILKKFKHTWARGCQKFLQTRDDAGGWVKAQTTDKVPFFSFKRSKN